jgi:hypothetical protein
LCTHRLLFLGHISCEEPYSQRRAIGSLPFLSALTFHCRTAGSGESRTCRSLTLCDVLGEIIADIFAGRRSTFLQFGTAFFGVTRAPKHTNLFTTSKFLSPKTTVCPASRIVLFPTAKSCILSLVCWFSTLLLLLLPPVDNLSKTFYLQRKCEKKKNLKFAHSTT